MIDFSSFNFYHQSFPIKFLQKPSAEKTNMLCKMKLTEKENIYFNFDRRYCVELNILAVGSQCNKGKRHLLICSKYTLHGVHNDPWRQPLHCLTFYWSTHIRGSKKWHLKAEWSTLSNHCSCWWSGPMWWPTSSRPRRYKPRTSSQTEASIQ